MIRNFDARALLASVIRKCFCLRISRNRSHWNLNILSDYFLSRSGSESESSNKKLNTSFNCREGFRLIRNSVCTWKVCEFVFLGKLRKLKQIRAHLRPTFVCTAKKIQPDERWSIKYVLKSNLQFNVDYATKNEIWGTKKVW